MGVDVKPPSMAGETNLMMVSPVEEDEQPLDDRLNAIVDRLETLAQEQVSAKTLIEERWLRNLRAYHGRYDVDVEANLREQKTSRAFIKATRSKTVALEARLFDLIFPTDDRNWGIEATPVPKLAKELAEAKKRATNAAESANLAEMEGNHEEAGRIVAEGNDEASRAHAAEAEVAAATAAADKMQEEMDDQLVESRYPARSRDMIRDGCRLGTGILKGPMVNEKQRGRWMKGDNGFALTQTEDVRPMVRRVDPWAFFPDMSASCIEECEFTFERYLWTKRDLRKMVNTHGFNKNAVRRILDESNPKANKFDAALNYLTQLKAITGEGESSIKGRYVGWEYHGALEPDEIAAVLTSMGEEELALQFLENVDPLLEFRVILHFCNGQVLKIAEEYPLDSGETLYSVFNVEEAEGSIFGYGIPEIMNDNQVALNAAWRMGLDNAALSVGPQGMIDKTQIQPADGDWTMRPKKIWLRIKSAVTGQTAPPIEFFNVPNNMNEIRSIIEIALQMIDMETGMPMPQQGDQTSDQTKTVGGMTILQNAANIIFRRMVKNYDDGIIAPTMRRLYDWNMQFNPREDIKGDMQIDARGTAVLLLKEIQAQNLMFVVTQLMNHPVVQPMLKAYPSVMKLFQSMMISPSDVMVSEDEYKENMNKLAQQEQPPSDAEINAQARIQAANIMAQSGEMRGNLALEVEMMKREVRLIELAQHEGLSLAELKNRLDIKQLDNEARERIKAVEIATEDERAREAVADGHDEVEATGQGIG